MILITLSPMPAMYTTTSGRSKLATPRQSYVGKANDLMGDMATQGKKFAGYGWGLFNIVVATLMGVSSSISATFMKDNTAGDVVAKGGIVGAVLFAIAGLWKIIKVSSENTKAEKKHVKTTPCDAEERLKKEAWHALVELNKEDGSDLLKPASSENDVFAKTLSGRELPSSLHSLHCARFDVLQDLCQKDILRMDRDYRSNYIVKGLLPTEEEFIEVSKLSDQYAFSRAIQVAVNSSVGTINSSERECLPAEFVHVYESIECYKDYESQLEQRIKVTQAELKTFSDAGNHVNSENLTKYIEQITTIHNRLKILQQAMVFASNTTDPASNEADLRKASLYRSAIVSGFEIRGNSLVDITNKINEELVKPDGVNARVEELDKLFKCLVTDIAAVKEFPYEIKQSENPDYLGLIYFEKKPISV
jgi:hypothetical protein